MNFVQLDKNQIMKKVLLMVFLIAGLAFRQEVKAQQVGFYFYPDLNVYYNTRTHQYAYQDHDNWVYRRSLPRTMRVYGHSHVTVYGNNPEIWRENAGHREKYRDWDRRHGRDRDRRRERDRDRRHDDRDHH
jgi:hypothetical protein